MKTNNTIKAMLIKDHATLIKKGEYLAARELLKFMVELEIVLYFTNKHHNILLNVLKKYQEKSGLHMSLNYSSNTIVKCNNLNKKMDMCLYEVCLTVGDTDIVLNEYSYSKEVAKNQAIEKISKISKLEIKRNIEVVKL